MQIYYSYFHAPFADLLLLSLNGTHLAGLYILNGNKHNPKVQDHWRRDDDIETFNETVFQLQDYFNGKRKHFTLPLSAQGTKFQKDVWMHLRNIPYGETVSYTELARRLGNAQAVRAVGQANGRNPLSIIIPCHRVVGADGSLTGYGGGLECKRYLLEMEADFAKAICK